jgi:hypothetical protein
MVQAMYAVRLGFSGVLTLLQSGVVVPEFPHIAPDALFEKNTMLEQFFLELRCKSEIFDSFWFILISEIF